MAVLIGLLLVYKLNVTKKNLISLLLHCYSILTHVLLILISIYEVRNFEIYFTFCIMMILSKGQCISDLISEVCKA